MSVLPNSPNLPEQFKGFTNTLQICTWLVQHSDILQLANKILDTKRTFSNITFGNFSENHNPVPIEDSGEGILGCSSKSFSSNVIDDIRNISSYFIILLFILL